MLNAAVKFVSCFLARGKMMVLPFERKKKKKHTHTHTQYIYHSSVYLTTPISHYTDLVFAIIP